jgi:hypothetical protein
MARMPRIRATGNFLLLALGGVSWLINVSEQ